VASGHFLGAEELLYRGFARGEDGRKASLRSSAFFRG
jgi:hypothetical protein